MWIVAALTFASGLVVAVRMRETLRPNGGAPEKPEATCIEVAELGGVSGAIIVDVRSAEEFADAHVEGARNIPLDSLARRATELPKDAPIVTVCTSGGGRSERAAAELRAIGFSSVRSLCGGTKEWMRKVQRNQDHG
jgi:rhodanese-related sulfurtransferase